MVTLAAKEEKRKSVRFRSLKKAQISFQGLSTAIDCVIRDSSETGLRLKLESPIGIPEVFDLVREGLPVRKCRIVWRGRDELGVAFV